MLKQLKQMGLLALTCAVSLFTMSVCAFAKPDWPLDTGLPVRGRYCYGYGFRGRFICPEYPCAGISGPALQNCLLL